MEEDDQPARRPAAKPKSMSKARQQAQQGGRQRRGSGGGGGARSAAEPVRRSGRHGQRSVSYAEDDMKVGGWAARGGYGLGMNKPPAAASCSPFFPFLKN